MHSITHGAPPTCLSRYSHSRHTWDDLHRWQNRADLIAIRCRLDEIQHGRCAYCEAEIGIDAHIDHFRQRHGGSSPAPHLTFSWTNLLRSCTHAGRDGCCGKFKDEQAGAYVCGDLINPAMEDPELFLVFRRTGFVEPRDDDPTRCHRATETIRILNLNCKRLKSMRENAIRTYHGTRMDIVECPEFLEYELQQICNEPFATAIKHFLSGV